MRYSGSRVRVRHDVPRKALELPKQHWPGAGSTSFPSAATLDPASRVLWVCITSGRCEPGLHSPLFMCRPRGNARRGHPNRPPRSPCASCCDQDLADCQNQCSLASSSGTHALVPHHPQSDKFFVIVGVGCKLQCTVWVDAVARRSSGFSSDSQSVSSRILEGFRVSGASLGSFSGTLVWHHVLVGPRRLPALLGLAAPSGRPVGAPRGVRAPFSGRSEHVMAVATAAGAPSGCPHEARALPGVEALRACTLRPRAPFAARKLIIAQMSCHSAASRPRGATACPSGGARASTTTS